MRVGIVSLLHESNTFISTPTTLDMFKGIKRLKRECDRDPLAPLSTPNIERIPTRYLHALETATPLF